MFKIDSGLAIPMRGKIIICCYRASILLITRQQECCYRFNIDDNPAVRKTKVNLPNISNK